VVIVAFACEPRRGSEPGVGWSFAHNLAEDGPVWVVTHAEHREPNEAYFSANPAATAHPIHITYVALPRWLEWLRSGSYAAFNIYYYLWQFAAARALRRLHAQHAFDVVQHVSLVRWWMPTAALTLAKRGVKFVWGPIGAGETLAANFRHDMTLRDRWMEWLRRAARGVWQFDPLLRSTAGRADVTLASTRESKQRVERLGVKDVRMMTAISPDPALLAPHAAPAARPVKGRRFRLISGGGLIYWKRFDIAVRAFALANLPDAEYVHVCGGEELESLKQLANDLGVADRVHFPGEMNYTQCVAELRTADAMIHPVLRDSGGLVVEAMTLGVPVMTLDHLSGGWLVSDDAGYKAPVNDQTTIDGLVNDFARVMREWYDDRELLERKRQGAIKRGQELSRAHRGRELRAIYSELLAQSGR
jgi:glycosyltransferase involved in cell wall biosynthesis